MYLLNDSDIEKTLVERDPVLPPPQSNEPPQTPIPAAPARPVVGQTRIGFSLVVDSIGVGGMASVYKVWNERLELFRAIKMLSADAPHARFETEVKLSAKLHHPNIVEVYNVGEWNGIPYMEMEYVDGSNLQEILNERGRLPDAVSCAAAICVATALNYAHTLKFTLGGNSYDGIIHRDLKPANIIVSKNSEIKLTDFGIARPAQVGLHTIDGNIVGTLNYLSPEQMDGGAVDQRSDLYSLGTIIYEMATGAKAFPQKSITELTKHRAANSFKQPNEYDAPVNPALADIIVKCLKAPAAERYQSAAELIDDLQKAYRSMTRGNTSQKTLHDFLSGKTTDTRLPPTTSIIADRTENTLTDTPQTAITPAAKPLPTTQPTKLPSNNAIAYTLAALFAILTLYITFSHKSPPPKDNTESQQTDAAQLFAANTANAKRDNAPPPKEPTDSGNPNNGGKTTDTREPTPPIKQPTAAEQTSSATYEATTGTAKIDDTPAYTNADTSATVNTYANAPADVHTNAPTVAAAPTKTNTPPTPPATTEDALIKSATDAMAKKEWDRAIRILEKNGAVFTTKRMERTLLLLEGYVESRQLDKARPLIDGAAPINDAMYFLTAGRYWFYKGDHANALTALETSLTRPSLLRGRNAILNDAIYYIALVRSDRLKTAPTDANRTLTIDAWKRVKTAHAAKPESPQFKRAEAEIAALTLPASTPTSNH